jgi:diketogulonate reductase-like aldo/keto reductase
MGHGRARGAARERDCGGGASERLIAQAIAGRRDDVFLVDKVMPQVALAWVLRQTHVVAVPKSGDPEHVRENRAAPELALAAEDLDELDRAFPPPDAASSLEML